LRAHRAHEIEGESAARAAAEGEWMVSFWKRAAEMLAAEQTAIPARLIESALVTLPANDTTVAKTEPVRASIQLKDLRHKDHTRYGVKYGGRVLVGHHADIEPKKWIRLYGHESNHVTPHDYDITFKVGDVAVYGGFNLTYTGTIVGIDEKTVRIREAHDKQMHTLDIATFSNWNRDFDLEKIAKHNNEWMD
jgi:hypothetical protein